MSTCILRDMTVLGDGHEPYIVAEVNTSHYGNMDVAKELIRAAAAAGCNCVKFQSWSPESLYSEDYYKENKIAKRILQKFSFSEEQLLQASLICKEENVAFCSTPYSRAEVDFLLEKCNAPYIKVASMDLTNLPFLDYIARTGAPIILATGMSDMNEICDAVTTIKNAGNVNLCLLHCISIYPPEISTIRLNNIIGLRSAFPECPIGFSDHSLGIEMDIAAVAIGAAVIEKHLTLDRTKVGMDNQMALETDEMILLVRNCQNVFRALGSTERIVMQAEIEQRLKMRRSIVAARELKKNEIIREEDLDAKRPGTGLPPDKIKELIGKRLAKDVKIDSLLAESDFDCTDW